MLSNSDILYLKNSGTAWHNFADHIGHVMDSLYTLDGIDFTEQQQAVIEARARQLAHDKLYEIMEPFFDSLLSTSDRKEAVELDSGIA
jgi:hypothetical protein